MKNIIKIDEARTIASEIGFSDFADLRKTRTLTPLLKHAESSVKGETLSGVYLQFRPEGLYIGQAVNLTQRHQRHLDEGREIAYLDFLPVKPERLDEMEGRMIDRARELGYADRLLNVSKLPGILKLEPGFSLDDALPPARQVFCNGHDLSSDGAGLPARQPDLCLYHLQKAARFRGDESHFVCPVHRLFHGHRAAVQNVHARGAFGIVDKRDAQAVRSVFIAARG